MNNETMNTGSVENAGTEQETAKTFTQEEVDALIQSETDRRVSQALKTAERKNEAKIKEAEKLAKMNEAEKFEYELKQREAAIIEKEKQLALLENKNEASKILNEKGLSLELVDLIVGDSAETMNANISLLEKAFKNSVNTEVEKRLHSTSPKQTASGNKGMTKEQFNKMTIGEQMNLYKENPELYKALI